MEFEIYKTDTFNNWFNGLKDKTVKYRILARLKRISLGNFGDVKSLEGELFEIRFKFGSGYRIYYTKKENNIIILLKGGDKGTQTKDIKEMKKMMRQL